MCSQSALTNTHVKCACVESYSVCVLYKYIPHQDSGIHNLHSSAQSVCPKRFPEFVGLILDYIKPCFEKNLNLHLPYFAKCTRTIVIKYRPMILANFEMCCN